MRITRRIATAVLSLAAVSLAIAATTASAGSEGSQHAGAAGADKAAAGGVYRTEWQGSFDFTGGFDPTGEYLASAFGLYSNLLVRTLVGYNHVAGSPGNIVVPDLATDLGKITNGGKTYTFKLKDGIKFGPPLNREITSKDILFAFQRIGTPSVVAQYAFYYDVIKGMAAFKAGTSKVIAGIKTPDLKTIIFNLTVPTGDFRYRLALPAAGPIPQEVAGCFTQPLEYGRYVISSGPYMIAGSDKLNAASCDTIKASGPLSGFDGTTKLDFVRNPAYNAKSDSPKARENLPDEFTFTVNSNADDIFAKVDRGDIEDEIAGGTVPAATLRQYQGSKQLKINNGDRTNYLMMNLSTPPFDDIHVRRAVNWVINKEAIRKAWGGPLTGVIATHIVPDPILGNKLKGYAPYGSGKGDLAKAKAEMKLSRYDSNHDGVCDGKACNVFTITGDRAGEKAFLPSVEQSMKSIGLVLNDRVLKDAYTPISIPKQGVPFSTRPGWGKDYADPYSFFGANFDGRAITPSGNANRGLIGITPAQAKKLGVKGNVSQIPSINKDLDKCQATLGDARFKCYSALDKKLMTDVVPWMPWMWTYYVNLVGKNVTKWDFDQFATTTAYAHVAVK
ncbi:MAG: peptide/nickel transport system substrate-binding protein [Gaiellales bacterium]|nr:peptide/nickel transport system substrate-binding protein [Gaiellales bacterium]